MMRIYNQNKDRFLRLYGQEKFEKLYQKVNESNSLVKLTGLTVNKGLPPTANDFLNSANTILYVVTRVNIATSVMAALIELKIWNANVNSYHQLISDQHIELIAERIAARWI
jgi:hypothetical protein